MYIPMIDTLYFSLDIANYPSVALDLLEELEVLKAQARVQSVNKSSDKTTIDIGSMTFEVLPNGANGFAYILHNSCYQLKIAQFRSNNPNFYPIMVNIKAEALWSLSPEGVYSEICEFISQNIGEITSNKVSRVDLCCHTDSIDFTQSSTELFKGNYRSTNVRFYNRQISGMEYGNRASKVFCRIYNKLLEVKQKNSKLWFFEIWDMFEWDGAKTVWNIEFELKRNYLTGVHIDTVEDVFASLSSMWHYLMDEWLVMTNNDRTRIENATINPEWAYISTLFNDYISRPLIKRDRQMHVDSHALIPALNGYAKKIAALRNTSNIDDAFSDIKGSVDRYNTRRGTTFENEVDETQRLLKGANYNVR